MKQWKYWHSAEKEDGDQSSPKLLIPPGDRDAGNTWAHCLGAPSLSSAGWGQEYPGAAPCFLPWSCHWSWVIPPRRAPTPSPHCFPQLSIQTPIPRFFSVFYIKGGCGLKIEFEGRKCPWFPDQSFDFFSEVSHKTLKLKANLSLWSEKDPSVVLVRVCPRNVTLQR